MQAKNLTENTYVGGQLSPEQLEAVRQAGVTTIICNRPDGEMPDQTPAEEILAAAQALGMAFHHNPIGASGPTPEAVEKQRELIASAEGKVLAYCASGRRSTVLWMLANPEGLDPDERIMRASEAGYDLAMLRPNL